MLPFSHTFDCNLSIYDLYLEHGNNGSGYTCLAFAALKAVLNQTPDFFRLQFGSRVSATSEERVPTSDPSKRGYDILLNMVMHLEGLSLTDRVQHIVMGVFLMNCLEAIGYMPPETDPVERVFYARLLSDIYNVILSNNHSISYLEVQDREDGSGSCTKR